MGAVPASRSRGGERSAHVLRALADATRLIGSAHSGGERALETLTSSATALVEADLGVIQFDGDERLIVATEPGLGDGAHDPEDDLVVRRRWLRERLEIAETPTVRLQADEIPYDERSQLGGIVASLLRSSTGDPIGVVYLARVDDRAFNDEDEAILGLIATLAVVTMENARLSEAQARQEAARFRDELLAGMSHDMHTPLSVIVGIADSLTDDPDLPVEERVPIYETIARQARRLRSLVNQFLDFSRIEAERPLTVDLRPVDVVDVIDQVVPLFTHQREIIVGADESLREARADRERLEQILVNLLSNAVKYSDGPVRIVARNVDDGVIIDVVDEGRGLTDDELSHIFDKFHRGRAAAGTRGTGLGLYISRALAEAQGGELHAMSAGMGSRFRVRLPTT